MNVPVADLDSQDVWQGDQVEV